MNTNPPHYQPPVGAPLYWRHETSGQLAQAVDAFLTHRCKEGPEPTTAQIRLLADYLEHWAKAPCWRFDDEDQKTIESLRQSAQHLLTSDQIAKWLHAALQLGLDPL